ncbi:MAG TPA: VOC family protein [Streptosporangiaceae bacterium]|jgi:catechol-2,3-dioxygenase
MIGHWHGLVIDTPDPRGLASFYEQVLGMQRLDDSADWVTIGDAPDRPGVAFQQALDLTPPTWPDTPVPQQMHLDIRVEDLAAAEQEALSLGAKRLPGGNDHCWIFADPSGHPFCLFTA